MSILSVHDIQGISAYNNTIRVPSGHVLNVAGRLNIDERLKIPVWSDATRPTDNLSVGDIGWNTDLESAELYGGVDDNNDPIWYALSGSTAGGDPFPAAYRTLIDTFAGTKYYVSTTGSNSNAGTSETSTWATPDYAFENAPTGSMIIILPGEYNYVTSGNMTGSGYNHSCVWDHNKNLKIVCAPGQVTLSVTNTTSRDFHAVSLRNNSSHLYGAYIRRNNNGRNVQYSCAFMGYDAGYQDVDGDITNCVIREVNSNGSFSAHYDNSGLANWIATNCLFIGTNWLGNYSGGAGVTLTNCASNNASWTTSGTNTNTLTGATVQSNFSTGTTQGVYAGPYAWDATKTTISF